MNKKKFVSPLGGPPRFLTLTDAIIEKCWGECCRPFGEDGVTQETAENDFCSFAKEATYESLCK